VECYSGVVEAVGRWRFRMLRSGPTTVRLGAGGVTLDSVFTHVAVHRELAIGRAVDLFVHRFLFLRPTLLGVRRHDTGAVTTVGGGTLAGWLVSLAILTLAAFVPGALLGSVLAVACGPARTCRDVVSWAAVVAAMLVPVVSAARLVRDVRAVRRLAHRTPETRDVAPPAEVGAARLR
jgi:hypothetical protein